MKDGKARDCKDSLQREMKEAEFCLKVKGKFCQWDPWQDGYLAGLDYAMKILDTYAI